MPLADLTQGKHIDNAALRLPFPRLAEGVFYAAHAPISVLTDEALFKACSTRIAFTSRSGGISDVPYRGLDLSYSVGDDPAAVDENRRRLCEALGAGMAGDDLIAPLQVHGSKVIDVHDVSEARRAAELGADGICCTRVNVPVLLCFADCVPVTLVAPDGSFCIVHSGWRGTYASIAGKGLRSLSYATSFPTREINCYIGPHIGACCYEVADELLGQFIAKFGEACDAGSSHLDLSAAVTCALLRAGADARRILDAGACTSCHADKYYSYRAEDGLTGRHGAFAIRKGES